MEIIPKPVRNLWNNWDIRVFVLCSLLVQVLLIFFALHRKRTANRLLVLFTWSLYLLADWIAAFALGLLANSETSESDCALADNTKASSSAAGAQHSIGKLKNKSIIAFWAPFLILHLGGPDTITAFAMEDNELWLRHLLGVVFQVGVAVYVFLLSVPKTKLLIPTILIFVAGIMKYIERTYALYLASLDGFRDSMLKDADPGPNYAKLMEEFQCKKEAGIPVVIKISPEPNAPEKEKPPLEEDMKKLNAARKAFKLVKTFKGLIVELMFSFHERAESRSKFLRWSHTDAFRVIEYELEFVYEVLFTKAAIVHNRLGYFLRFLCSCSIIASFFKFFFTPKHDFLDLDVAISYTLLGGAIALDAVALVMLLISDMTLVKISRNMFRGIASWIINTKWPRNRWSVSISQHNLLRYCFPKHQSYFGRIGDRPTLWGKMSEAFFLQKALNWLRLRKLYDLLEELEYTSSEAVSEKMKKFIFSELKNKTEIMNDPKAARSLCSCRGNWALEQRGYLKDFRDSVEIDFDESLLRWHIATTLCYYKDKDGKDSGSKKAGPNTEATANPENKEPAIINVPNEEDSESSKENQACNVASNEADRSNHEEGIATAAATNTPENEESAATRDNGKAERENDNRELSKQISDYMIYLLMMQPAMMSSVAVSGRIRFRDTCAEAKNFFLRRSTKRDSPNITTAMLRCGKDVEKIIGEELEKVLNDLLSVQTEAEPILVKGDRSKSVLFDGCILAKRLMKQMDKGMRWTIMAEVWVEMLGYAAGRCNGIAHAQRLSKGGELLTFIWFLMAHLGLGEQYRIEAGHARAKLLVGKQ